MSKGDRRTNKKVLRLCRNIYRRADDFGQLQFLVGELQEVLRQVTYETLATNVIAHPRDENPFDKIMVA